MTCLHMMDDHIERGEKISGWEIDGLSEIWFLYSGCNTLKWLTLRIWETLG